MYIWVYVHVCECMHKCACLCEYMCMFESIFTCMCVGICTVCFCVSISTCMCVYMVCVCRHVYVCVWEYICVCLYECTHVCGCMVLFTCRGQNRASGILSYHSLPLPLEAQSLPHLRLEGNESQQCSGLCPSSSWGYIFLCQMPGLFHEFWNLNSAPHDCTESPLHLGARSHLSSPSLSPPLLS